MDAQQIKRFIDAMAASDLSEMEVGHEGWTLRLVRRADGVPPRIAAAPSPAVAAARAVPARAAELAVPASDDVRAPMFGVVHLQRAPGEPAFVKVGDIVEAGQMLCSIEAMKVFNELHAERAGRIVSVHVESGSEVEAGQALFAIEPVPHV